MFYRDSGEKTINKDSPKLEETKLTKKFDFFEKYFFAKI